MVYYAYGHANDYDKTKEIVLAEKLAELLKEKGYQGRILDYNEASPRWRFNERGKVEPYVEINGPFGAVTIRKMTYVANPDALAKELDKVYDGVMA
tara:strand:- start:141 stop:428 length:288 start_codon:yes stop_codon:yes gene_type:complete